jgi:flagellin-specific chaperone FliS
MTDSHLRHRSAAAGYRRIRNESLANQSTPQELILLVYESLIDRLIKCQGSLAQGEDPDFDRENLKCMQLIQYGLRDSLSFDLGGEVAVGLDHTYSTWMLALEFLHSSRSQERLASLLSDVRGVRDAWKVAFGGAAPDQVSP